MAVDLLEFQRDLWARLQRARASDTAGARLGVSSGNQRWLMSLQEIDSVMPLPPIAAIPGVKSWYCGLVNVRGSLYGVIDLAQFLGGEATLRNMNTRIVVLSQKYKVNAAILVAQVLGLQNLSRLTPQSLDATRPNLVRAQHTDEERNVWHELNLAALARDDRFMRVAA